MIPVRPVDRALAIARAGLAEGFRPGLPVDGGPFGGVLLGQWADEAGLWQVRGRHALAYLLGVADPGWSVSETVPASDDERVRWVVPREASPSGTVATWFAEHAVRHLTGRFHGAWWGLPTETIGTGAVWRRAIPGADAQAELGRIRRRRIW